MNKRGFTLIELIIVIIILGVILMFSLPNITSGIERNKKDALISDAKDFIIKTRSLLSANPAFYPSDDEYAVFNLEFIDVKKDITSSQFGVPYNRSYSFVLVYKNGNTYDYRVSLLACGESNGYFTPSVELNITREGNPEENIVAPRYNNSDGTGVAFDDNKDGYLTNEEVISKDRIRYKKCAADDIYVGIEYASIDDLEGTEKYSYVTDSMGFNFGEKVQGYVKRRTTTPSGEKDEVKGKTQLGFYY